MWTRCARGSSGSPTPAQRSADVSEPRPRPDRQLRDRRAGRRRRRRSSGPASRVSTATRCSARCCASGTATTDFGFFAVDLADLARTEQDYLQQHRDPGHAPLRPPRRRGRNHRLRAALQPVRPHLPPDDAGAPRAPDRRAARGSASGCGRPTTTARTAPAVTSAAITSATSRRTWCCGSPPTARSPRSSRRRRSSCEDQVTLLLGPDETVCRTRWRRSAGASSSETAHYWREWVRDLSHSLRVAGRR